MIGRRIAAPRMGEVVDWRSFFLVTSRASAQPTPNARVPHIKHQSTRFWSRMCFLRVSSIRLIPWRVIPQNPLILGTSLGISSLNVYGRISAQEKHITTLNSSKCASRQNTHCAIVKTKEWGSLQGVKLTKACFKGEFTAKFQSTAENVE
jgi:hypothetical protein